MHHYQNLKIILIRNSFSTANPLPEKKIKTVHIRVFTGIVPRLAASGLLLG
jgi:hypothetical protein